MEAAVITAVGIDVSKSKSTVAVRRPGGEIVLRPFEVHHTNSDLKKLASTLKKLGGDIRIVMEHTSTYWRPIALTLKEADFFVSVVNAMLIHDFSDNTIRKLKTDRADALKIANYALTFWDTLPPFNNEEETRLLLKMQSRANERITATATALRNGLIALADQTFPGGSVAYKTFNAGFIDRKNLFQKNHGRFFKSRVGIHQHMGRLVFLL
jgi:transposase